MQAKKKPFTMKDLLLGLTRLKRYSRTISKF